MLSFQERIKRAKILEDRLQAMIGDPLSLDELVQSITTAASSIFNSLGNDTANDNAEDLRYDEMEAEIIELYRDAGEPWTSQESDTPNDALWLQQLNPNWKAFSLLDRLKLLGKIRLEWAAERSIRSLMEADCNDASEFSIHPPLDPTKTAAFLQKPKYHADFTHWFDLGDFSHMGELRPRIAQAIAARLNDPEGSGFSEKIWNRARVFNPNRVLDLTIKALVWNVMEPRMPVQVECGGWEIALSHEQLRLTRSNPSFPEHPTLKAPWRVMQKNQDGLWHESALGSSIKDAWEQFLIGMEEVMSWGAEPEKLDFAALRRYVDHYEPGAVFKVSSGLSEHWLTEYRIMQDHADLDVVGSKELVTLPSREGLKAREIWFQRFASVIKESLPEPVMALRFAMDQQAPRSPRRTFFARFDPTQLSDVPSCCECGKPCELAAYFSFRHHALPFRPPGEGLLLFTCGDRDDCHQYDDSHWHKMWLKDGEEVKRTTIPILAASSEMHSGPAMWVKDYEQEKVDESLFDRTSPQWSAFDNSWEKSHFCYATPGTKIGGAASTIQCSVSQRDRSGNSMHCIAQIDHEFFEIGDSGRAYVMFSPATGEIMIETQCF